jgi:hypothetical protein
MGQIPKVTIIVLNYNGLADTLACLESLASLDYPESEVVVIDNASSDGSVAAIHQAYPNIKVIETGQNLGYAEGNNVGLRYALETGADYILLLNNDTTVAADFLFRLIEATEADPEIGVAGPTIYYFDHPNVIWSAGGAIDWQRGQTAMLELDETDVGQFGSTPRQVDFVSGCALLIKRSVVERVGLLDARFFMYYEETEWCHRLRRAGYQILHVPQAKIWHKISSTAREASPQVHYYMTRNRLLFLKLSQVGIMPWVRTFLFDYGRTLISWTLKPKWRHKTAQRQAMLQAILDYWQGNFGQVELVKK